MEEKARGHCRLSTEDLTVAWVRFGTYLFVLFYRCVKFIFLLSNKLLFIGIIFLYNGIFGTFNNFLRAIPTTMSGTHVYFTAVIEEIDSAKKSKRERVCRR
jgi:hypothetical protein